MRTEWWTVYGSFYLGPQIFYNNEEAEKKYEEVCNDLWSTSPSLVHSVVLKRKE